MMKDSGIEWIGEIPENWEIHKIKHQLSVRSENNRPIKTKDILSLTIQQGVVPLADKEAGGNKPKENFDDYKLAYPGDIVLNSMNFVFGAVGLSKWFGCISPVYYCLYLDDNKQNGDIRYYHYLFASQQFQKSCYGLGNGILEIRMRIPIDKLISQHIPVPPIETQHRIADYLDDKTAILDEKIAAAKSQIENLKAYRAALIHDVVCHGVPGTHDNSDYVNSSIQWIGDIPKGWQVKRIKHLGSIVCGATPDASNDEFYNGDIIWITPADMNSYGEISTSERTLTQAGYESCSTTLFPAHSIIISTRAPIGKVNYAQNPACTSQGCKTFIPDDESKYYYYALIAAHEEMITLGRGTTFKELRTERLNNIYLPVPNFSEQQEIASYLDTKITSVDNTIINTEQLIEDLEEYKRALIYEVVTGKKEI